MKPLASMNTPEIFDRVKTYGACYADASVDRTLFISGEGSDKRGGFGLKAEKARKQRAAEMCGSCSARGACEEFARRIGAPGVNQTIHGGYYFGMKTVVNLLTGESMSNSEFFKD